MAWYGNGKRHAGDYGRGWLQFRILAVRAEGEFALTVRNWGNRYTLGLEGGLWSEDKNDVWYAVNARFSDGRFAQS